MKTSKIHLAIVVVLGLPLPVAVGRRVVEKGVRSTIITQKTLAEPGQLNEDAFSRSGKYRWQLGDHWTLNSGDAAFGEIFDAVDNDNDEELVAKVVDEHPRSSLKNSTYLFMHATGASLQREADIMKQMEGHDGFIQLRAYLGAKELSTVKFADFKSMYQNSGLSSEQQVGLWFHGRQGKVHMFFMENGGRKLRGTNGSMMEQLKQYVDHMHEQGIYHLDLKPDNVLVKDSVIKIIDFGFSIWEHYPGDDSFSQFFSRARQAMRQRFDGKVSAGTQAALDQGCSPNDVAGDGPEATRELAACIDNWCLENLL